MSVAQSLPKLSQTSTSTPRAPSIDHMAISKAPVSEAGDDADEVIVRHAQNDARLVDGELELGLSGLGAVRPAKNRRF